MRRRTQKLLKVFLIVSLVLFIVSVAAFLVALRFTPTKFLLLRVSGYKASLKAKIPEYEKFITRYPSFIPARLKLVAYYSILGVNDPEKKEYFDSAIAQCKTIFEIDSKNEEALVLLGDIYTKKGELDKAQEFYQRLVEIDSQNSKYFFKLASNYYSQDKKEELFSKATLIVKSNPGNAMAHFFLARLSEDESDIAEAIAEYKNSLHYFIAAQDKAWIIQVRYRLGLLYTKVSLVFDAVDQFEHLIKTSPDITEGYLVLATIYYRLGLLNKSISVMESGLEVAARISNAQRVKGYMILGSAYLRKGDYNAARSYFERAESMGIELKPDFIDKLRELTEPELDTLIEGGNDEEIN
jgi:tetratricopeptide (TPR) repeat protein